MTDSQERPRVEWLLESQGWMFKQFQDGVKGTKKNSWRSAAVSFWKLEKLVLILPKNAVVAAAGPMPLPSSIAGSKVSKDLLLVCTVHV